MFNKLYFTIKSFSISHLKDVCKFNSSRMPTKKFLSLITYTRLVT